MKFRRRAPELPEYDVDRTIAMIRANQTQQVSEMVSLLAVARTNVIIDDDRLEESCNRVADVADDLGLPPEDMHALFDLHDQTPQEERISWPMIVAAHMAEELETSQS